MSEDFGDEADISELFLFNGMEGFEDLDDFALLTHLDDLQEEDILTSLNDGIFATELFGHQDSVASCNRVLAGETQENCDNLQKDNSLLERESSDNFEENTYLLSDDAKFIDRNKRLRCDNTGNGMLKRIRLDSSADQPKSSVYDNALASVMHDHCYATTHEEVHISDGETSNEEESSSDTGYDTMSSSTSPGSRNSGNQATDFLGQLLPSATQNPVPNFSLSGNLDPVALIDQRIKHYMCSREVNLTEEEKEILKLEGLPIPTTLPLTKVEEKALKSVRRKIRNRVAAQESRKRKKELMQTLEDRVSDYSHENVYLKKRVELLENENKSLVEQLGKLQAMISNSNHNSHGSVKVGTCIMVIILCFAVFYGGTSPASLWSSYKHAEYATATVRSRSLLSVDPKLNFPTRACDWFKQIFMRELDDFEFGKNDNHVASEPLDENTHIATTKYDILTIDISRSPPYQSENVTQS